MIECSNPYTCVAPYTDSTKCSGATWVIDATISSWTPPLSVSTPARYRMVSPALSSLYGANTGIRGQIWDDPTYSIHAVPNANLVSVVGPSEVVGGVLLGRLLTYLSNPPLSSLSACHQGWVHFVGLKSTVATGAYAVVEVSFTLNGINYLPGTVTWYPKDVSVDFFADTNPSNYYAVIGKSNAASLPCPTTLPCPTSLPCPTTLPCPTSLPCLLGLPPWCVCVCEYLTDAGCLNRCSLLDVFYLFKITKG